MLTIREDQLRRLERNHEVELIDRLCAFFRTHYDKLTAGMDEPALRRRIVEDVDAARSFGVESPRGTLHFVMLALLRDQPRLYQYNQFADALRNAGKDVERQLGVLVDNLRVAFDDAVARGAS